MSATSGRAWPVAELDPVRRVRVLAAGITGAGFSERVLDAPYDQVWSWLSDLERSIPSFDPEVDAIRVTRRDGDRIRLLATARLFPVPYPFDVRLTDGFCMMRAAGGLFLVVMGARPEGDGRTRYAQIEAAPRFAGRLARRRLQRSVEADGAGIERELRKLRGT
ncbi:MAG TPA: hypothetical protein VF230_05430 [Acidimicrobiales bacterium]